MKMSKLASKISFIRGITFKPTDVVEFGSKNSTACMRTKNVQTDLDESDIISVPDEFVKREKLFLQDGDSLISTANSWNLVGKCCYVPKLGYKSTAGGFIAILRPKNDNELDRRYFYHWLSSPKTQHYARLCGRQTTNISNIDRERFLNLEIPLPPLKEQKRIAAILDKADGIRRKRQQAMAMADEFLRSVFLDMFGDPVTNPKGWEIKEVKKIGKVTTGNTPSRKRPDYYGDDVEWIKSDNINTPSHYLTRAAEGLSSKGKAVGRTVGKDAILVTCIAGSPDCIGNLALADREVAFNQQINALETNDRVDELFMYSQLMVGKKLIQKASTNSMKGMVSKGKFELIPVMVPPMDMQLQFSRIFCKQMKMVQNMELHSKQGERSFSALAQELLSGRIN